MRWPGKKREQRVEAAPRLSVQFTPAARQKLLELLAADGPNARAALRLTVKNPGHPVPSYDMGLEPSGSPNPGDLVLDAGGFRVLVDPASVAGVDGTSVDFVADPLRPGFRVDPPAPPTPNLDAVGALDPGDPLVSRVRHVIDHQVNPSIASHGGRAELMGLKEGVAYVALGGGCQGCAMASVTLKQGVEQLIRQEVPQIRGVVDVTDHAHGSDPFFTESKGGASPFHQSAKS